ncbi:hypothetical protein BS47DRAFT_1356260, partial [Hydnum rufescens UP504]
KNFQVGSFRSPQGSSSKNSPKGASEVAKILEQLLGRIDDCCESSQDTQKDHVKLMLPGDLDGKDMYDVLCSCFSLLPSSSVFVIYLSTQSDISDLAPRRSLSRSARARENPEALQAPITETPSIVLLGSRFNPGELKLEDVYTVDFMAQSVLDTLVGAGDQRDQVRSTIVDLAPAKTAVLDVLLNLDFEPRRQVALDRETQLVAGHMRVAFSVPKECEYIRSGYPSEPLLAEAASRQMDEFQQRASNPSINVMAQILQSEFNSGILDQGQRGEVVFRLLLSEAYRRAVREDHPDESSRNFSKGCKLTTFIGELFSASFGDQILTNAVVRFTHFGKTADDSRTTHKCFIRCFRPVYGNHLLSSQETIDLLIPVLLEPREALKESVMTGILIQVKRHQQALKFFPSNHKSDSRPYITLVAELGIQLPIAPEATAKAKVKGKPAFISPEPKLIAHPKDVHPRYSIVAYGCSNTVYNVISALDRPVFNFLLANRDILAEHPRPDEESLRAVRRMKPFWSAGSECYAWVNEPPLRNYEHLDDDDEGCLLGKKLSETSHYNTRGKK